MIIHLRYNVLKINTILYNQLAVQRTTSVRVYSDRNIKDQGRTQVGIFGIQTSYLLSPEMPEKFYKFNCEIYVRVYIYSK